MNKSVRDELKDIISEVVEEKLKELFEENLILMTEHLTEVIKENTQKSGSIINESKQYKENKFKNWLGAFSEENSFEHQDHVNGSGVSYEDADESVYVKKGGGDFSPGGIHSKTKEDDVSNKVNGSMLGSILANTRPLSGHEQMDGK